MGGGAIIFSMYTQWPLGCEKSIIRKLFIMLQASLWPSYIAEIYKNKQT